MRIQMRYFAIFAIFWSSVAASSQSFFPNTTELLIGPSSFVKTSVAYALCPETSQSNEKHCNVFLETINEDDSTTVLSCKVVFKAHCKSSQIGQAFQLVPQSDDKLVIIWTDHANRTDTYLKLTRVWLSNCGSFEKSWLYRNDYYKGGIISANDVKLFRYEGDAEYSGIFPYTRYCGSGQYCRLTVDFESNIISEKVEWLNEKATIIPIERSPEKYVVVSSDWNNLEVTLAGSNVTKTKVIQSIKTAGKPASYSTANNILSVCYKTTAKTSNCSMINLKDDEVEKFGEAPRFTNASVTFKNRTILTSVYSLPRWPGGLIVLSVECPDEAPFVDRCASISSEVYRLTLLNAFGKQIGSLRLEGFQCDSHYFDTVFNFFEKDSITYEYCLSMGCYDLGVRTGRTPFLRKAIKCFYFSDF